MKDTENLKQDYLLNIPIDLLAKKYNTTENAIRLRMSKLKIKRNPISKSDKITINNYQKDIIQDYQKLSIKKLSKKYKFDERTIANCLKRNNIEIKELTNQIYTINENYFDVIDSEDKAYFLGLFYAD
jgi:Mor family transcriptional regulator